MTIKLSEEIKSRHLYDMGQCKVGLEVRFGADDGCHDNQKDHFMQSTQEAQRWLRKR